MIQHVYLFFFFNDTATTDIYTLSLHDALPISPRWAVSPPRCRRTSGGSRSGRPLRDRKSTRLNSSHGYISYAVFCLKKKKKDRRPPGGAELSACAFSSPLPNSPEDDQPVFFIFFF